MNPSLSLSPLRAPVPHFPDASRGERALREPARRSRADVFVADGAPRSAGAPRVRVSGAAVPSAPPSADNSGPITLADRVHAVGTTMLPAALGLAISTYSAGAAAVTTVLSGVCASAALVTLPGMLLPGINAIPGYAIVGTNTFAGLAMSLATLSVLTGFSSVFAPMVAGFTGRPLGS